jgi:hypothetical protein
MASPIPYGQPGNPVVLDPWTRIVKVGWNIPVVAVIAYQKPYGGPLDFIVPGRPGYVIFEDMGIGFRVTGTPTDPDAKPVVRPTIGASVAQPWDPTGDAGVPFPGLTPQSDQPAAVTPYRVSASDVWYLPTAGLTLPPISKYYSAVTSSYEYFYETPGGSIQGGDPAPATYRLNYCLVNIGRLIADFALASLKVDFFAFPYFTFPLAAPLLFDCRVYVGGTFLVSEASTPFEHLTLSNVGGKETVAARQTLTFTDWPAGTGSSAGLLPSSFVWPPPPPASGPSTP